MLSSSTTGFVSLTRSFIHHQRYAFCERAADHLSKIHLLETYYCGIAPPDVMEYQSEPSEKTKRRMMYTW